MVEIVGLSEEFEEAISKSRVFLEDTKKFSEIGQESGKKAQIYDI